MTEQDIDSLVNQVPPGGTLTLSPPKREFEGPVIIRRPLTLVGQDGLIWAKQGPVLRVECSGVVLQDLNVEITGREEKLTGEEACAILVAPRLGMTLNDVCVRGNVTGLPEEEGDWRYPRSLRMKVLPNQKQAFSAKFTVPVPCRLVSNVAGVTVEPSHLKAGETDVTISLDSLASGVRLRGEISLKTAFLIRQIAVIANVSASASKADSFQVTFWDSLAAGGPSVPTPAVDQEASATAPTPAPASRPSRKAKHKVRNAAEQLGPGSTPVQKPIPEKLEPKREPAKATGRHVPDVFETKKAPSPPTPTSKIKSVPLVEMWSQPDAEPVKGVALPSRPEDAQYGPIAADQEAHAKPAPSVIPVPTKDAGPSGPSEANAGATLRKRPVLDFSAFEGPLAPAAQPQPAAQTDEDKEEPEVSAPADQDQGTETRGTDSDPLLRKPEALKSRKLRKTDGDLGAFRRQ